MNTWRGYSFRAVSSALRKAVRRVDAKLVGYWALVSGQAAREIALGSEHRRANADGSTLLWERVPGGSEIFREEKDQLPPVLIHGNRY